MICAECAEEVDDGVPRCPACGGEPLLGARHRIDAIEQVDALGTTYRATRVADATPLWLRELPFRRGPGDPGSALEHEAQRLATLQHPALPSWIEHFVRRDGRSGALWLVQAGVAGTPLARLARERSFDESELLARLELLADLLRYLHGQTPAIVHGGLAPSTVIEQRASKASEVRLLVVGFNAIGTDRQIPPATGSGGQAVARVMASVAPEQFFGRVEPATDVWGLGLIAIVLLTGSTPLELRDAEHRLLWRERVAVDESLAELLEAMLDPEPGRRPSADELCKRIAALRRSQRATVRIHRNEVFDRDGDRPAAIAGSIGTRSSESDSRPSSSRPTQTRVVRESPRPVRRTRRSPSSDDVPVMRPADLSRELSQAFHATEQLLGRARRRMTAARVAIVLAVALVTALAVWLAVVGT
jgi:serine/threonine protein kinase